MKKLLLLSLFALAAPLLVEAQTFTVNVTTQGSDGWNNCANTFTDATPTTGSLVEGLARMNSGSVTIIEFAIPGAGPHVLNLSSANPELCSTGGLIDGNTQANIQINGQNWAGLRITGNTNTVRGLEFLDILNIRGTGNIVDNCTFSSSNSHGVQFDNGATGNTLSNSTITGVPQKGISLDGGTTSGNIIDNVTISGLSDDAIYVNGASSTTVQNSTLTSNEIGVNAQNAATLTISSNEISAHNQHGIIVQSSSTVTVDENYVHGNGTDQNNTPANWNGITQYNSGTPTLTVNEQYTLNGIYLDNVTQLNVDNNVVTGNMGHGIRLEDCAGGTINTVTNNKVGVEADGITPNGNFGEGIATQGNCNIRIGGNGSGNQVCANGNAELFTGGDPSGMTPATGASIGVQTNKMHGQGIEVRDFSAGTVILRGNFVGTTIDGNATNGGAGELGNHLNGIYLVQSDGVVVGGITAGQENVIGGNGFAFEGVHTSDSQTDGGANTGGTTFTNIYYGVRHGIQIDVGSNNDLFGNHIGIGLDGTSNLANSEDGISILGYGGSTTGNEIGGATADHGNLIGGSNFGIAFQGGSATGNTVLNNVLGGSSLLASQLVPILTSAIKLQSGATGNQIGNTTAGNIIVGNTTAVEIFGTGSDENDVQGNIMVCNTAAINLYSAGNIDFGPVYFNTGEARANYISGFSPNVGDRVDIYVNDDCGGKLTCQAGGSAANHAGMTYITSVVTITDNEFSNPSGWALWELDLTTLGATTLTYDNAVVTATDASGNTSEFNSCINLVSCVAPTTVSIAAGDETLCPGESTTISTTVTFATGTESEPYTYALYLLPNTTTPVQTNLTGADFTINVEGTYRVEVYSPVDQSNCSTFSGNDVTIDIQEAVDPGTISSVPSGPYCADQTGVQFTVTGAAGSTYAWQVISGNGVLTSNSTLQSVSVDFGSASSVVLEVLETTASPYGCEATGVATTTIVVNELPSDIPFTVSPVCAGDTVIYSVVNPGGSTFEWSVNVAVADSSTLTNETFEVVWGSNSGNITIIETDVNGCVDPTGNEQLVTVNQLPITPVVTPTTAVCVDQVVTYNVQSPGNNVYNWTIDNGSPSSASDVSSLDVSGTSSGTMEITVTSTTIDGCVSLSPFTGSITVNELPSALIITGPDTVCLDENDAVFSVPNITGSSFQWTVLGGSSMITQGQTTNEIRVDFTSSSSGVGQVISVLETNANNCSAAAESETTVDLFELPVITSISGDTVPQCSEAGVAYSVPNNIGSSYVWTVPTDAMITSGNGTNAITVDMSSKNGSVTVYEISAAGCVGPERSVNIRLQNCALTAFFEVQESACEQSEVTYTDQSSGDSISSWIWDFGIDASPASATGQGPHTVVYSTSGPKTASLIVENPALTDTFEFIGAIVINPLPTVTGLAGAVELCEGSEGEVYSVTHDGVSTYDWNVIIGSATRTNTSTNEDSVWYNFDDVNTSIEVIQSTLFGCIDRDTIDVVVNGNPILGTVGDDQVICAGDTVTLIYSENNVGSSYSWNIPTGITVIGANDEATLTVVTSAPGGIIELFEINSNGCADSSNMEEIEIIAAIIPEAIELSGKTLVCNGAEETYVINNFNSAFDYSWVGSFGIAGSQSSFDATIGENGSIIVNVSNPLNALCNNSTQLEVNVAEDPVASSPIGPLNPCENDTVSYQITPVLDGATYAWTIPNGSVVLTSSQGLELDSIAIRVGASDGVVNVQVTQDSVGCSQDIPTPINLDIREEVDPASVVGSLPNNVCDFNAFDSLYTFTFSSAFSEGSESYFGSSNSLIQTNGIDLNGPVLSYSVLFPSAPMDVDLYFVPGNTCGLGDTLWFDLDVLENDTVALALPDIHVCSEDTVTISSGFVYQTSVIGSYSWYLNGDLVDDSLDSDYHFENLVDGDTVIIELDAVTSGCIDAANTRLSDTIIISVTTRPELETVLLSADKEFDAIDAPTYTVFDQQNVLLSGEIINSELDVLYAYTWEWNLPGQHDSLRSQVDISGEEGFYDITDEEITTSAGLPRVDSVYYYFSVTAPIATDVTPVCFVEDSILIIIDYGLFVPSAFSPNNDGTYDEWTIKNIDQFPNTHIQVYNRWGNLIYDNIDDAGGSIDPWPGTKDGKEMPMGTYFYIVDPQTEGVDVETGDVSILR